MQTGYWLQVQYGAMAVQVYENQWAPFLPFCCMEIKEKFFNVDAISDLKLRVSYGLTGNQEMAA